MYLTVKQKAKHLSKQEYNSSGKQIKRRIYWTAGGKLLNADVNGALNIMKKSRVVNLRDNRGEVDKPVRIRVA